ncbi:ATP-binding protein [Ancylothrix sp. C2]|uniref:ATP-binding protein n=1 Tax=Ancylothrix sp. D3o TaxID=2953691 RepID=UPI0021BB0718|nr:anti-sigma regulatory factor [Ancylothrix sp. D3o]MCT7950447.1 ATP-binding protein [Ancylothrix sp. D3o]
MESNDLNDSQPRRESSIAQLIEKANLCVPTQLGELSKVLSWFDRFNHPPLPKSIWMECQLALAEAFTNVVRHAHKNYPPEAPIEIQVALYPQKLEIRIWDRGQPFNLDERLQTLPPQTDHNAEGGRGLPLLSRIADDLSYTQTSDQRNCLLIVKNYTP